MKLNEAIYDLFMLSRDEHCKIKEAFNFFNATLKTQTVVMSLTLYEQYTNEK